jgi:hypothetical protein
VQKRDDISSCRFTSEFRGSYSDESVKKLHDKIKEEVEFLADAR